MMMKRKWAVWAAILLLFNPARLLAAELAVNLELPEIDAAEYHRPYVAVWLEDGQRRQVLQMALWVEKEKWHRDLRSWWRRGGNQLVLPVDGVSGATRKPGDYRVVAQADLVPGRYTLHVESVREVGGREHLRFPFEWSGEMLQFSKAGQSELGSVTATINPENAP
mgnify:CR=1 FL=1